MYQKKTIVLFFILAFTCAYSHAQRHYSGITGVEINMGGNIFHSNTPCASLEYSKYKSKVSFWKLGINYLQKAYSNDTYNPTRYADNIYFDASYNGTVATNRKSLFYNFGGGILSGVEMYSKESRKYDFIVGCELATEIEFFIASRTAVTGSITQLWSPLSSIRKWDTIWQVGIKYLIY